ncbi:MAG: hypothetical protein Q7S54_00015 [bacterium]|nr:hypothetical protein [bacterium]
MPPNSSKNSIFVALALLMALIFGGMFLFKDGPSDTPMEEESEIEDGTITVSGAIACLPYRLNIAGQSCVKGIKGEDGKMYALNSPRGLENAMSEGTKVTAVGIFEPADTSTDDSSSFIYDGVLVIRSLIRR